MYWALQSRIRHPVWERLCRITDSGQTLYRCYHFPLGETVNRVDVKHPPDASGIALMHAADADEAGAALLRQRFAHPDVDRLDQHCAVLEDAFGPVWRAVAHLEAHPSWKNNLS